MKEKIRETILAIYPEDLFPEPEHKPKNNEVAYVMREMSGAIAQICEDVIKSKLQEILNKE